jgi:LPXTG-motif cell wall-anchored protein
VGCTAVPQRVARSVPAAWAPRILVVAGALPKTGVAGLALLPIGLALVVGGAAVRRRFEA